MNININPQSRTIPNVVASFYHLCGKISIDTESKLFSVAKRGVILTEKNRGERRSTTDENGEYCFEVKPGNYVVLPIISNDEKDKGLRLLPADKSVVVNGEPVLNVNFS